MVARWLIGLIAFYRRWRWRSVPCCRFYPTCSTYAQQVLREQPLWRALGWVVWRLCRCHPWAKGGVDLPPNPSPFFQKE